MAEREYHASVPSTQTLAIERARAGAPGGTRVVAGAQTDGRGRADHRWFSPPGGLYVSSVVDPPPRHAAWATLVLGARLADRLGGFSGASLAVKWPNDVLAFAGDQPPRKLAGLLADRVAGPDGRTRLVVGVGVNVARPPGGWPVDVALPPVGLEELTGASVPLRPLELAVLAELEASRALVDGPDGADAARTFCRPRLYGVGRPAAVDGVEAGRIAGLADDGALLFEQDGRTVVVHAGDVAIREGR